MKTEALLHDIGVALGELYLGGDASVNWPDVLDDLNSENATRRPVDLPHSVAEIVAHVQFWQLRVLSATQGEAQQNVPSAAMGWPAPDDWEALKTAFYRTSEALQLACANADLLGELDFRGKPQVVGLIHFAAHSVHHLGQVISVRQTMGLWPPPNGGDTW